jgi:hypothetical protein
MKNPRGVEHALLACSDVAGEGRDEAPTAQDDRATSSCLLRDL